MAEHRQEFERELEAIEARIIELFAIVAEDLPEATKALLTGNNEIMQRLTRAGQGHQRPVPGDRATGQPGDPAAGARRR